MFEINKDSGTELKALEGSIGQVSARTEIGQAGICPRQNYFDMKALDTWPIDAPDIPRGRLEIIFATSVRRNERQSFVRIDNRPVLIEAALDDISYLKPVERNGEGLYDALLMDIRQEDELEFELKTDCDLDMFFNWVRENCIKDVAIQVTSESKASRAWRLING